MEKEKLVKPQVLEVEQKEGVKTHQHDIFTIIEWKGVYRIALANKIISSKTFEKLNEARMYINRKPWELLINASVAVYDILDLQNQSK